MFVTSEHPPAPDETWPMRARRWLARYVPAEITAILFSYAGYYIAKSIGVGLVAASYASSWAENIGFYAVMAGRTVASTPAGGRKRALMLLVAEFGPAELIDSLLTRPASVAALVYAVGPGWGILLGKLIADVLFYALAIFSHELLRARHTKAKP